MTTLPILQVDTVNEVDLHAFLRRIFLFADFSDDDLRNLLRITATMRISKHMELFAEGSIGKYLFIIQQGEIEIFTRVSEHELILAIRKAGDIIGEAALFETSFRMASARARSDSLLLLLPRGELDYFLEKHPGITRTILYTTISRWHEDKNMLTSIERERMALQKRLHKQYAASDETAAVSSRKIPSHLLVLPLIGTIEERHTTTLMQTLIHTIFQAKAYTTIIDVSNVEAIESHITMLLMDVAHKVKSQGIHVILTGLSSRTVQAMQHTGIDMHGIETHPTLQDGIIAAQRTTTLAPFFLMPQTMQA